MNKRRTLHERLRQPLCLAREPANWVRRDPRFRLSRSFRAPIRSSRVRIFIDSRKRNEEPARREVRDRDRSVGSGSEIIFVRGSFSNLCLFDVVSCSLNGRAQQLSKRLHIFSQRLSSSFRHAIKRLRFPLHKLLLDANIPGFFQLEKLRSQVAVRRPCLQAQPGKLRLFHAAESSESKSQAPASRELQD